MSDFIDELLAKPVHFLDENAPGSPVAISSRIRLARNIRNYPFPTAADKNACGEVAELIAMAIKRSGALGKKYWSTNAGVLEDMEKAVLLERHLASRELLHGGAEQTLHIAENRICSVMVNEEDHLRLQALMPGLQLDECFRQISELDDKLSSQLDMAYDATLGYLTACPSNLGTGIRVSVMLHLPALAMDNDIKPLEGGLAKLGFTIRGMFGEGSEDLGHFYQISNQSTLGESEAEIIAHLQRVIDQIIEQEESMRCKLLEHRRSNLLDAVGRSYGILKYGYMISAKEAFKALSLVRLGVDMKMFSTLDTANINELFISISSGHLQHLAGRSLSDNEEKSFRAQLIREKFKNSSGHSNNV
ncbi:MAG: protein arginine kinase [Lentisphaeria bacterium]|nr:protein arginine kinase [Lentisphaeria bacterium]